MSQLLQEKFPAEEASLNYIESDNYAGLRRHYKSTLEEIRQTTKRIAADKGDFAPLIAEQGKTVHTYFSTSAQSDAMAQLYAQQYEQWEQYLDKHELSSFEKVY